MTGRQAQQIIKAKKPHSTACRRHETGAWDRSGDCERCLAWTTFNEAVVS
jgi:hypothetical protein